MRTKDRRRYLFRACSLIWSILFKGTYDFTFDLMPITISKMTIAKRINLLKSGLNLIFRRLIPFSWPIFMQIELTNYCNLHCPVCPTGRAELTRKPAAIDADLFEALMDEVGRYLLVLTLWAWGEPLLHPNLSKILSIAKRFNVATLLSTNGQNLNDQKVLDSLITYPPTYLIVAIDGLTDETNAQFRIGAKLEPILNGVRRLSDMKKQKGLNYPIIHMRYMVMKHNQHEVDNLQFFAEDNRFDFITLRTLSIIDGPEAPHRNLVPDAEELRAYQYYENNSRRRRRDFICQQAFICPSVFADGTVVSCEQDFNAQYSYGTFSNELSFENIWFNKKAAEIRRVIRDNPADYSFCRNCPYSDRPTKTCSIKAFNVRD